MTVGFELDGLSCTALNGGPMFKFTEAISLVVHCETQPRSITTGTSFQPAASSAMRLAQGQVWAVLAGVPMR